MQRVLMLGLLAIVILGGAYFFTTPKESDQVALHRDADVVALGLGLYEENCAACHGADLRNRSYLAPPNRAIVRNHQTWDRSDSWRFLQVEHDRIFGSDDRR